MRGKGWARVLLAVLATVGLAATASASGKKQPQKQPQNSITAHGPIAAAEGVHFSMTTSGYASQPKGASNPANYVVGWKATAECLSSYKSELASLGASATPELQHAVKKSFNEVVTLTAGSSGTVYWCAYLINHKTGKTFKYVGWRYAELGRPGPGAGPGPGPGGPGTPPARDA